MQRAALALAAAVFAGCGGAEKESAPVAWCNTTGRIVHWLDQYSTTLTTDELGEWEESAPDDIRASVADAAAVLRRYPVNAEAPALVGARKEIEEYADESCPEGWRDAQGPSSR